jgi:hypothetical protein
MFIFFCLLIECIVNTSEGMGIYKNFTIPILLIDPIPYRFSYRFSLGEKISTNVFVCIKSL